MTVVAFPLSSTSQYSARHCSGTTSTQTVKRRRVADDVEQRWPRRNGPPPEEHSEHSARLSETVLRQLVEG